MFGPIQTSSGHPTGTEKPRTDMSEPLRRAAHELEATFVYEMLKSAGIGDARGEFGGGVGEEQFASLLLEKQADLIVQAGGFGLAERIFENLLEQNK